MKVGPSSRTTPPVQKPISGGDEITSVAGLVAYVVPNSGPPPDYTYFGGSRIGSPPASGGSAVLRDGRINLCRVPGNQYLYKAAVVEILLGSHLSPPHATLRVDWKGAIAATTGTKRPACQSRWVLQARQTLLSKSQSLEWIEGHTGHVHPPRTLGAKTSLYEKQVPEKQCFGLQGHGFSAPKIGGVLMKTFLKGSFTRFFKKMAPGGGRFTRFHQRGTNYLHTTLLKRYHKSNCEDSKSTLFGFSAPRKEGVLMKPFSKGSFTPFVQKKGPQGGGRLTRFHQTWH